MSIFTKRRAEAMKKPFRKIQWLDQGWSCCIKYDSKLRLWIVSLAPFPADRPLNEADGPALDRLRKGFRTDESLRIYPDDGASPVPGHHYAWMDHPKGRIEVGWNMRASICRSFGWPEPPRGSPTKAIPLVPSASVPSASATPPAPTTTNESEVNDAP